jgi:hypothetical protein
VFNETISKLLESLRKYQSLIYMMPMLTLCCYCLFMFVIIKIIVV